MDAELRADNVHLLAHFNEDHLSSIFADYDPVGILVVEGLARLSVAEQDVGRVSGRRDRDALDSAAVDQRQNLARSLPGRRKIADDNTPNLSSCRQLTTLASEAL